jgi:hypothetical protein
MKKIVLSWCILLIAMSSLAPNMQGMQLLKLPNFISHVNKHYGSNWTFSELQAFIVEHYQKEKMPRDKEHENLPFKTPNSGLFQLLLIEQLHGPCLLETAEFEQKQAIVTHPADPTIDRSSNIWTPPQLG